MKILTILIVSLTVVFADRTALEEFVNANNLFAASLYKTVVSREKPNILMSPFSAETVLAFAQSGCKDETAQEIRTALHLPDDKKRVETAVQQSLPALTGNAFYTLQTANKMYVKEGFPIKEDFKNGATSVYQADTENIDFEKKTEAARTMNEWVEKQTNNKIRNLIDPNLLNKYTRTILINALYFKGNWTRKFYDLGTTKKDFFKTSKDVVQVDTMHQYREWFNYYENTELNARFLELPFEGGDVSMIIALPNEKEGLASLENQMEKVFAPQQFKSEFVNIAIPKFKVESKFSLKSALEKLGMRKAFDKDEADLSGIAGEKGSLVISHVVQQTYIDVEEGGVEAAAATFVAVAVPVSAFIGPPEPEPKEFIADHPFIFYIKAKGFIIFAGRVSAPGQ